MPQRPLRITKLPSIELEPGEGKNESPQTVNLLLLPADTWAIEHDVFTTPLKAVKPQVKLITKIHAHFINNPPPFPLFPPAPPRQVCFWGP